MIKKRVFLSKSLAYLPFVQGFSFADAHGSRNFSVVLVLFGGAVSAAAVFAFDCSFGRF